MYNLPTIDRETLANAIDAMVIDDDTKAEFQAISSMLFKRNSGQLRASKPKVIRENHMTGKAAYVWRMVAFTVSPNPKHHCMPMTADFDLPAYDSEGKWRTAIARPMAKELDLLVDTVIACVPVLQHYGTRRWVKAFYG